MFLILFAGWTLTKIKKCAGWSLPKEDIGFQKGDADLAQGGAKDATQALEEFATFH